MIHPIAFYLVAISAALSGVSLAFAWRQIMYLSKRVDHLLARGEQP